jgi:hypothetical protein
VLPFTLCAVVLCICYLFVLYRDPYICGVYQKHIIRAVVAVTVEFFSYVAINQLFIYVYIERDLLMFV